MSFSKGSFFYRFVLFLTKCIFKCFYRYRLYGKGHYFPGGGILAPNHVSFYDPPIVAISCPEEIHFLARETLFVSFFGKVIRRLNSHPLRKDLQNIAVLKKICQLLKEGKKVLIFPEGTRSLDNQLAPIKPGIGLLLSRSQSAILPIYVHGMDKVWGKKRKFPKLFGKLAVVFGSPILWSDYVDMDRKEAQVLIAEHLTAAISKLKNWYEKGAVGIPP